jgi:dTDP-4-dehydrorhamnose reductase
MGNEHQYYFFNSQDFNLTDVKQMSSVISKIKPSILVNCAAYTDVDGAESDELISSKINEEGVRLLAGICYPNTKIIHISSDYVFDGFQSDPYTSNSQPNPLSIYGKSKLGGEIALKDSACDYLILRTSWVFSEFRHNFLKTIHKLSFQQSNLNVINDQIGTPTYAMDLAEAILYFINNDGFKKFSRSTLHFSGADSCSWYDFAKIIIRVTKNKFDGVILKKLVSISTSDFQQAALRPKNSALKSDSYFNNLDCLNLPLEYKIEEVLDKIQEH